MSEEILKALTQLFAIISKQDGGVTEKEREFIINFYQQDLDSATVTEYVALYDRYAEFGIEESDNKSESADGDGEKKKKQRVTRVNDAVKVLSLCRKINKTLTQSQKVIVLFKILEMVAADRNFTSQRMEIIETVATVFNIPKIEYKQIVSFVTEADSHSLVDSEDILIFDDQPPPEGAKAKFIDSGLLDGEIIFLRVNNVGLYFTKYTGGDEIFLNGKQVRTNNILLFSPGSVFKTPKGAPLYYSDLVSRFNSDTERQNISFNVVDMEYRFANGAIGLRNINLSESSGRLIGIMGASGAGKTTLLNALAGLEFPSSGKVLINGFDLHDPQQSKHIEGVIGYIAQDDLLIEELSVYQNLYYNAKLCFKDLGEEELNKKVVNVLTNLGLDRIMNLKVGNVLNKKISGGQRKRLNIALELIREPSILFVDEPTSGLSSRDSENVIDLLKELSLKGKLIFVVIHQPSSDIYKMFDKMWLMDTGGFPVFYGNPIEAVTYFKKATRQVGSDKGQCMTCGNVNPEQIFNIIEARVVDEYGEFTNKRKIRPEEWHEMYQREFTLDRLPDIKEEPPKNLKIPSKITQTIIFTTRDVLSKISNKQYMLINLLEAPMLALLMALVIRYKYKLDTEQYEYIFRYNDNIPAYILICIVIALFMGLTVSAEEIIRDRKIKKREYFLNLSKGSYLTSKVFILFVLSAIQTITFVVIGNLILDVKDMNMAYWLVLFSVSCFANVLGLNISSAFDSAVTVYILIPLLLIPQMILSGAIFSFDKLNNSISEHGKVPVVADFWVSRWAYEALMVQQFKNNPYESLLFDWEMYESQANFKASYWFPEMEKKLIGLSDMAAKIKESGKSDSLMTIIETDLALIRTELLLETQNRPVENVQIDEKVLETYKNFLTEFKPENVVEAAKFTEQRAEDIRKVLDLIKAYYIEINNASREGRDLVLNEYEPESLTKLQNKHFNDFMKDWVRNTNEKIKIVIQEGRLIQKTDPIFFVSRPNHAFDYRSHFFAPEKHFLGSYFPTYFFNVLIIWLMTVALYVTLYTELLRKLIEVMGKIKFGKSRD